MKKEHIIGLICSASIAGLIPYDIGTDGELVVVRERGKESKIANPLQRAPENRIPNPGRTAYVEKVIERKDLDNDSGNSYFSGLDSCDYKTVQFPRRGVNSVNFNVHPQILSQNWGRKKS